MKLDPFLAQRSDGWRRLSQLLDRLTRAGPGSLAVDELEELGRLYRRAASDLAYARAHFHDPETVSYLNHLVARGHSAIYLPARPRWRTLWLFFARDFPCRLRRERAFWAVSAAALLGSGAIGAAAALLSPQGADLLVPPQFREVLERAESPDFSEADWPPGMEALLGSHILTNNLRVGFLSFALGIAFGAGTLWVLAQNGLMLGVLSAVLGAGPSARLYWPLILPHGGMELVAITVCGASGLILGWGLISPGDLPRRDSLVAAGRRAVPLVLGATPIFAVAALVEAFVTPARAAGPLKIGLGALGAAGVLAYLLGAGRGREETREVTSWSS